MHYELVANVMKALSEPKRIEILDMLSCGEMCACKILESFDFTQPTLSHHMKVLVKIGFVKSRKEGTWNHYSLNHEKIEEFKKMTETIFSDTDDCVCHKINEK